jgi:hypothetical protein
MLTPAVNSNSPTEMIAVDPVELAAVHARDLTGTNLAHAMSANIGKAG